MPNQGGGSTPGGPTWRTVFGFSSAPPGSHVTLDGRSADFQWRVTGGGIPFRQSGNSRARHADVEIGWTGPFCVVEVLTVPTNVVVDQLHIPGLS